MATPRRHEETKGEWNGKPVVGEQVLCHWLANGAGGIWLHKTVDPDCNGN